MDFSALREKYALPATIAAGLLTVALVLRRRRAAKALYPAPVPQASAVLITGASSGIGRHASIALARKGLLVFSAVRSEKDAQSLRGEDVGSAGGKLHPVILDVTKPDQIASARTEIEQTLQSSQRKFLGLVNNAGISKACPIEPYPIETAREVFEINYFGLLQTTQAFLPLIRRDKGRIVNISSIMGFMGIQVHGIYCSSKFAVEGLTDSLRREMDAFGVSVSLVEPGAIATGIVEKANAACQDFLDHMPADLKPHYGPMLETYVQNRAKAFAQADKPDVTTAAITHALLDAAPRTRYPVGAMMGMSTGAARWMTSLLPDRSLDNLFLKAARKQRAALAQNTKQ